MTSESQTRPANRPVPFTERRFLVPFALITCLFFLWALGVNLNDVLIPRFRDAFGLSDFQSSFIHVESSPVWSYVRPAPCCFSPRPLPACTAIFYWLCS
jgi:hypothetical protein